MLTYVIHNISGPYRHKLIKQRNLLIVIHNIAQYILGGCLLFTTHWSLILFFFPSVWSLFVMPSSPSQQFSTHSSLQFVSAYWQKLLIFLIAYEKPIMQFYQPLVKLHISVVSYLINLLLPKVNFLMFCLAKNQFSVWCSKTFICRHDRSWLWIMRRTYWMFIRFTPNSILGFTLRLSIWVPNFSKIKARIACELRHTY